MVWFKVDDDLAFHAKAIRAGNTAMGVWVRAGSHCGNQLTDGFIDREVALTIGRTADIKRLVDAGLWEPATVEGRAGWRFHDFLERNPSREEVEKKRQEEADRKAAWRAKRAAARAGRDEGQAPDSPGTDTSVPAGHPPDTTQDTGVRPASVPEVSRSSRTRPDPVSPNGDTSSAPNGAGRRRPPLHEVTDDDPGAQQLVAAYVDLHTRRPPNNVIGQVARHVGALLQEGFEPDAIQAALRDLVRKRLNPSTLPSLVNEHANHPAAVVAGRLSREQVDDVLGPDLEPLVPPTHLDPETDHAAIQAWLRQARAARQAARERQALERLERVPT